jgi:hypothetical protein
MTWSKQQGMAVARWEFPGVDAAMTCASRRRAALLGCSFTASRCLALQLPAYMLELGSELNSNPLAVRELTGRSLDSKGADYGS